MPRRLLFRLLASVPSATDHVPDAELLRRLLASNDSVAFELLVRRHADAVWVACRRLLRSDADADDAFQATFLALIRKARSIRTPSAGGWLHRVAVHASLKLRERTARTSFVEPNELRDLPAPIPTESDAELAAVVHEELARLPERERLPVVLCDLEGLSHADAAAALGWPVGTVSGRLSRARAKLRERLARRGLAPSAALLPTLAAPPRLVSNALSLTAGASPAVVSLTEGVLAMMAQSTWKWVAVAAVCASALGAGGVLAFGPGGRLAPQNVIPATPPVVAQTPEPPAKDKFEEDEWLPIFDSKKRAERDKNRPRRDPNNYEARPTAFPELTIPKNEAEFEKLCPRLTGKVELAIEPTDDTLRKLLKARLAEGVLQILRYRGRLNIGAWFPGDRAEMYECLADIQATATELWGGQPKELIPWLEELVVAFKEGEKFHWLRVAIGTDPPQALDIARQHRFQAEIALWKAKKKP
ncbi:RNA polymerase sigma factor [Frigoriglobus tundricola]|uniref:ECF RNA polymerase sigma factor SigE n=1 Tax=Frigoriglobus tundricola TaxID=2774151 RepID=A0A6M5YTG6_9BACT|nr:sigma-70 family RNA polymerase sigma factor [Frigoriglobus tundricola]QJW96734.1 hypothetical protein FTUN_4293 [Frigoriglobus tundricola]